MIIMPTSQALAANFAPEEMRGRYMAVYGLTYGVPAAIAPGAAGLIMDNLNPNLVWYIGAGLCAVAAFGFYTLHLKIGTHERFRQFIVSSENE
jgi:MFS family permease